MEYGFVIGVSTLNDGNHAIAKYIKHKALE